MGAPKPLEGFSMDDVIYAGLGFILIALMGVYAYALQRV